MAVFLSVASGFAVSSQFVLERPDRGLVVNVPSMAGNGLRLQFTASSDGAAFSTLWGANADLLVTSSSVRPALATVEFPAYPWGRVQFAANVTDVVTVTLTPLNRAT